MKLMILQALFGQLFFSSMVVANPVGDSDEELRLGAAKPYTHHGSAQPLPQKPQAGEVASDPRSLVPISTVWSDIMSTAPTSAPLVSTYCMSSSFLSSSGTFTSHSLSVPYAASSAPTTCLTAAVPVGSSINNCSNITINMEADGKTDSHKRTFELVASCPDVSGSIKESRMLLCPFIWNDGGVMKWHTL